MIGVADVLAASHEAKAADIRTAISLSRARRAVPAAVVVPAGDVKQFVRNGTRDDLLDLATRW